ncbi:MAG: hypothetical protein IPL28_27880 [Chloroflexi bacterium]|nr:hypothetical protein [Chloroflexota bacterium]
MSVVINLSDDPTNLSMWAYSPLAQPSPLGFCAVGLMAKIQGFYTTPKLKGVAEC